MNKNKEFLAISSVSFSTSSQNLSLSFQIKPQLRIFAVVVDDKSRKLRYFCGLFTGYKDKGCSLFATRTAVSDTVPSQPEDILAPTPPTLAWASFYRKIGIFFLPSCSVLIMIPLNSTSRLIYQVRLLRCDLVRWKRL